jgi:hypothetical protein
VRLSAARSEILANIVTKSTTISLFIVHHLSLTVLLITGRN